MKKKITLNLEKDDPFFVELKNKFLEENSLGINYDVKPHIKGIMSGIFETLKSIAAKQNKKTSMIVQIKFEHEEYSNPDFYHEMEENISTALNDRIHGTTLERFVDLTVDFMVEYADKQLEAKKIEVPELVDSNKELDAITKYVSNNWDGFEKIDAKPFFTKIWDLCLEKTKNKFEQHSFTNLIEQWDDERSDYNNWVSAETTITKKEFDNKLNEDALKKLPIMILLKKMELADKVNKNWDFEEVANEVTAQIKKEFPDASKLRPKGWKEFKKNYIDYAGMSEFDSRAAKKEFGGMNSGTACSHAFEVKVALPYVMYDEINQNRKPLDVLVGAVLSHAYVLNEKNNSALMLKELLELKEKYDQPEYYKEPVTKIDFDLQVPLNKDLFKLIAETNAEIFEDIKKFDKSYKSAEDYLFKQKNKKRGKNS
jgi:hypothetical protein